MTLAAGTPIRLFARPEDHDERLGSYENCLDSLSNFILPFRKVDLSAGLNPARARNALFYAE